MATIFYCYLILFGQSNMITAKVKGKVNRTAKSHGKWTYEGEKNWGQIYHTDSGSILSLLSKPR